MFTADLCHRIHTGAEIISHLIDWSNLIGKYLNNRFMIVSFADSSLSYESLLLFYKLYYDGRLIKPEDITSEKQNPVKNLLWTTFLYDGCWA